MFSMHYNTRIWLNEDIGPENLLSRLVYLQRVSTLFTLTSRPEHATDICSKFSHLVTFFLLIIFRSLPTIVWHPVLFFAIPLGLSIIGKIINSVSTELLNLTFFSFPRRNIPKIKFNQIPSSSVVNPLLSASFTVRVTPQIWIHSMICVVHISLNFSEPSFPCLISFWLLLISDWRTAFSYFYVCFRIVNPMPAHLLPIYLPTDIRLFLTQMTFSF